MEETQRLSFFVTYRPSFVWTAILAFLHLTMIASTFLEVRGKTHIYPDIRTSVFQLFYFNLYIIVISDGTFFFGLWNRNFGIAIFYFSTHLCLDFVFLLALMKETIPALAFCSWIYLLDFVFYVYLAIYYANCDLEPEEFPVSSVMIGLFAFVHFMGFYCGLCNILGIKNSYCRKKKEEVLKRNTFVIEL